MKVYNKAPLRDIILVKIANFILKGTSKEYQQLLSGTYEYGLRSIARDEKEGRDIPPPVRPSEGD